MSLDKRGKSRCAPQEIRMPTPDRNPYLSKATVSFSMARSSMFRKSGSRIVQILRYEPWSKFERGARFYSRNVIVRPAGMRITRHISHATTRSSGPATRPGPPWRPSWRGLVEKSVRRSPERLVTSERGLWGRTVEGDVVVLGSGRPSAASLPDLSHGPPARPACVESCMCLGRSGEGTWAGA